MDEHGLEPSDERPARRGATRWVKLGVALLGLSLLLWAPLPVLPFLSLPGAHKAAVGGGLAIGAEVAFWLGAALAGPEAARRFRSWLRPALGRRRRRSDGGA